MPKQHFRSYEKEDMPLVTILMLCYRKFEYIQEALESVLQQDYPNYELIVADDGSENFPQERITQYIDEHPLSGHLKRVLIYSNEKNLGTVKNANVAIQKSEGKYILGLTADDRYAAKDVVSSIVKEFQDNNAMVVTGKCQVMTEDGVLTEKILPDEEDQYKILTMGLEELYETLLPENFIIGACTYYDRKCFEYYGLFDERFVLLEDWPSYLHLLKNNVRIHFLKKVTICYRLGGVSIVVTPLFSKIMEDCRKIQQYFGYPKHIKKYIEELINPAKKQVIYGTGDQSNKLLTLLYKEGIEPLCYMVSDGFSTKNVKNHFPVYRMPDFPFNKDDVQVLVSEVQTDAEAIIDSLKNNSFFVVRIEEFLLKLVTRYEIYD